mgnify:CR=1 FL=1
MRKQIQRNYIRKEPKNDYLKFYRVVRRFTLLKYDLSTADLEMMMYLYTAGLFTYQEFSVYASNFSWDRHRFKRMKEGGWIHMFRDKVGSEYRLYELTRHGRHIIGNMYKMLNCEMEIPMALKNNPAVARTNYSEKALMIGIEEFNKYVQSKNPQKRREY